MGSVHSVLAEVNSGRGAEASKAAWRIRAADRLERRPRPSLMYEDAYRGVRGVVSTTAAGSAKSTSQASLRVRPPVVARYGRRPAGARTIRGCCGGNARKVNQLDMSSLTEPLMSDTEGRMKLSSRRVWGAGTSGAHSLTTGAFRSLNSSS